MNNKESQTVTTYASDSQADYILVYGRWFKCAANSWNVPRAVRELPRSAHKFKPADWTPTMLSQIASNLHMIDGGAK